MSEPRKRRSTGRVTLAEVAKLAGVGTMTVSRALRTPDQVSDKLREQIQKAVDELGYIPNKAAGALASGQSYSVAVLLPSLKEKACTDFMSSFQQQMNKKGYQLLLGYTNYSSDQEEELLQTLIASSPAAIVLFGSEHSDKTLQTLQSARVPVMEIAELNSDSTYLNVGVDHGEIGKVMTDFLIDHDFKNIGFIGARGNHSILRKQLRGWQNGMLKGYLPPDHFYTTHDGPSLEFGAEGVAKLLLREQNLDAIICSHEEIAIGAMFECQRRAIKLPDELTIVCLDGSQLCEKCHPPLTAIHINYEKMGIEAAEQLISAINNQEEVFESTNIGFTLRQA